MVTCGNGIVLMVLTYRPFTGSSREKEMWLGGDMLTCSRV